MKHKSEPDLQISVPRSLDLHVSLSEELDTLRHVMAGALESLELQLAILCMKMMQREKMGVGSEKLGQRIDEEIAKKTKKKSRKKTAKKGKV